MSIRSSARQPPPLVPQLLALTDADISIMPSTSLHFCSFNHATKTPAFILPSFSFTMNSVDATLNRSHLNYRLISAIPSPGFGDLIHRPLNGLGSPAARMPLV